MKKITLIASFGLLLAAQSMYAQQAVGKNGKLDAAALKFVREVAGAGKHAVRGISASVTDSLHGFIVVSSNPGRTAAALEVAGYEASIVDDHVLTVRMTAEGAVRLSENEEVSRICGARRFRPFMEKAREMTNADKVHNGEGLETPFTGKGVVVGIVDQGFQYNHPAFRAADGNTRIKGIWNLAKNYAPTTVIPTLGHDGMTDANGHGTHVAGIAAGGRIPGNQLYGMAPEAEIVMIPTTLADDQIINGTKYVKDFAEEAGKPWVVNMSFGSDIGPHDGSQPYDQTLSNFCGEGGLIAAAMGNENGLKIHAFYEFNEKDTLKTLSAKDSYDDVYLDIWGNTADGLQHFTFTPVVYNKITRKKKYQNDEFWQKVGSFGSEINPYNKKEHFSIYVNVPAMRAQLELTSKNEIFMVEVRPSSSAGAAGHSFHAWMNADMGEFARFGSTDVTGNSEYLVGEGAATIPNAVSVGAYTGAASWVAATDGKGYQTENHVSGALADFSNYGPYLGADMKPTVCAPGANISSAFNRYNTGFTKTNLFLVGAVDNMGKSANYALATTRSHHFYGVMSGTSMASPAMAGILALWLQANPRLTPDLVKEIIKKTSKHDTYTGSAEWSAKWGYGKVDAYAGLKEALRLAEVDGIDDCLNTSAPVTLQKGDDAWNVLFNNDESFADITICALDGRIVSRTHLDNLRRGDEHTVRFDGLSAGIYVIRIATTASAVSRKVMVR